MGLYSGSAIFSVLWSAARPWVIGAAVLVVLYIVVLIALH